MNSNSYTQMYLIRPVCFLSVDRKDGLIESRITEGLLYVVNVMNEIFISSIVTRYLILATF